MEYFARLDVGVKETAICVVNSAGAVVLEGNAETTADAIHQALEGYTGRLRRVGHEAGALSPWLHRGLLRLGLEVVLLETRHVHAALKAQRNKTDRNDAHGVAQLVRSGWYRDVHVKSDDSYRLRLLLTHRRTLKRKFLDLENENEIRHALKVFGVKLHAAGRGSFDAHVRDAGTGDAFLAAMAEPMLRARAALWAEYTRMHALVVQITVHDAVCRRFMAVPGVGPVTALAFKTAVDAPDRFARSRDVGTHFGLKPKREQSGTSIDFDGHISRQGDKEMRTLLYEAASCLLTRSKVWTSLKAWGMKLARHRGHKRAVTAVARKLAVIMHAMWRDGTDFRFAAAPAVQPAAPATALVPA